MIALGGFLANYIIIRLALDIGIKNASVGFLSAKLVSLGAIFISGLSLFLSTLSGWLYTDVANRELKAYQRDVGQFTQQLNNRAEQSSQLLPSLEVIANELNASAECEARSSCISGLKNGGNGTVSKQMRQLATRGEQILSAFTDGDEAYRRTLAELNQHMDGMQTIVNQTEATIWERYDSIEREQRTLEQLTASLSTRQPLPLIRAYAQELLAGVNIQGRFAATQNVNAVLKRQGDTLSKMLITMDESPIVAPPFIERIGVSDTLKPKYLLDYLSVVAIIAVIEILLALAMWYLMYIKACWRVEQAIQAKTAEGQSV